MTAPTDHGPILVAGASGSERMPPRRQGGSPDWHQPEHVRDRTAARQRIEESVLAGADIVVAPAYLTHRRALSPYGETRRAAEWTRAAVEVAREAVEQAQERAAATASLPEQDGDVGDVGRSADTADGWAVRGAWSTGPAAGSADRLGGSTAHPGGTGPAGTSSADAEWSTAYARSSATRALVAGPMSPLRTGRFEGPVDPGVLAEEDRARADQLVEAGVDLLLIESMPSLAEARSAAEAAAATGVPFWVGLQIAPSGAHLPAGDPFEAVWQELAALAPTGLLITASSLDAAGSELDTVLRLADVPVGLWLDASGPDPAAAEVGQWLDSGASLIGLAAGATPKRIRALRALVDERATATAERRAAEQGAWLAAVDDAARRAAGGRALWLGESASMALPDGFHWTVLEDLQRVRLPDRAYGLVVSVDGPAPVALRDTARLVNEGGYLLHSSTDASETIPEQLMVQSIETAAGRVLTLLRRRP